MHRDYREGWRAIVIGIAFLLGCGGAAGAQELYPTSRNDLTRADVTRTETVQAPMQAVPADDEVRHRFTIQAQIGVDNQFSGKMIEAASGHTTGGAPIDFDETTYDEVYGRMAMFKVGVGYRLTPRTEAVLNFVYSRSSAEDEAVQIGTATREPVSSLPRLRGRS